MTAVGLLATVPGVGAGSGSGEADTGGRASADSGSLFGDALTAAGRTLDGTSGSGPAMPDAASQGWPTVEASVAPDRTIDPQAAIAAMTHLVAWSAPVTPEPSAMTPQAAAPLATASETTAPSAPHPEATPETTPGAAEATPAYPVDAVAEADAADAVPADAEAAPQTTRASETAAASAPAPTPASAPASASAAASASATDVVGERGEVRTQQGGPTGDVREGGVREGGVHTAAIPREPDSGGTDPVRSDAAAAVLRPEPLSRQPLNAIPSVVGAPAPGVGGSFEQHPASDVGDHPQGAQPVTATAPLAPVAPSVATIAPAPSPDAATAANRAVAAQVAPVVVSIAQRPTGTHQLTMTVNPDSLGPVTVRAHITASGEVQVELSGATDAGRDVLRTMLVELRRDLAAVMPHATLSVNHGTSADPSASGERGQQAAGDAPTGQGAGDREANRGRPDHRRGVEQVSDLPRTIQTTPSAASGAGLDIFA
ncbi:hypothetical protein [Microbacterium sp. APC 3901]|uniref:hypothetical protein n=1 Tax=Microbacterium sp. APC 3901 TaxID=3035192 RepID=UPI0025B55DFC|nr:hypothetical protein [Microbacterium sp. APC 3901]MDN3445413.1 hypothetical protein [Microbacterium sp. APC 3901]